jgi:hypothetical protein
MYISEAVKDQLRPYAGEAVEIDALTVIQRTNPGDGLIRKILRGNWRNIALSLIEEDRVAVNE